MPAVTKIKLRAGTQSQWAATAKTQSLSSATVVVSGSTTVVRYSATGHTLEKDQVVTITGFGVTSGNNPYNISGGIISAIVAGTSFDITVTTGTTGGTSSGTGTATLVVLAKGEAAVETDTNALKIGDGTTDWAAIPYVNKPLYYVLSSTPISSVTTEQDLLDKKIPLIASTTYQFEIQVIILAGNSTSKNFGFGFYQTGMTAFATTRYHWTLGTRANAGIHYSDDTHTFAGNSPTDSGLIDLYPADTNPVVFFNMKGIIRTGAGSSDFRPRIKWSAAPGTTNILAGSFVKLDPLGPSSIASTGSWA